jgi:hypothetical protein
LNSAVLGLFGSLLTGLAIPHLGFAGTFAAAFGFAVLAAEVFLGALTLSATGFASLAEASLAVVFAASLGDAFAVALVDVFVAGLVVIFVFAVVAIWHLQKKFQTFLYYHQPWILQ